MSAVFRFLLLLLFITGFTASSPSQERATGSSRQASSGSLAELRDKQRIWVMVRRTAVLDARGGVEESVLSEAYREVGGRQTFPRTYNMIARKLNKYMKERGDITASMSVSDAEFIIFFNVLEIRRPLGMPYAYGELFIILNQKPNPRIVWRTRDKGMFVDDAIDEFISALKASRGHR